MKVTVDTNVLVRAALGDDPAQAKRAGRLLTKAELIAVTLPSLCEFVWVLLRVYDLKAADAAAAIRALLAAANVRVNRPAAEAGLATLEAGGDFADRVRRWLAGRGDVCFVRQKSSGAAHCTGAFGAVAVIREIAGAKAQDLAKEESTMMNVRSGTPARHAPRAAGVTAASSAVWALKRSSFVALWIALSSSAASAAGDFPLKPVRLITGSPGSTADISARLIAHKLVERWGQQVLVDNRGGAGGIIGAEIAARSAPDGYSMFNGHIGTHASPQFLFKSLSYDPLKDFAPITQLTNSGIALVVHAAVPAKDLKEFVAYARSRAGTLTYGSAGGGTSSQLSGELFNQITGAKLVHVPYKGAGFALTGVASGEVQSAFLSTTTASAQIRAGKLRALAVLSNERFPAAPEIPTAAEQGVPGIDSLVWFGLFAPAKTPRAIVQKISRDVGEILRLPESRALLLQQGAEASPSTPEAFEKFVRSEIVKWSKVIKAAGIQPI